MAEISFATLLASSVHDMKNSVSMLLLSLHNLLEESPPQNNEQKVQFSRLEYEATRINNDLIQLLTLYRMDEKSMAADIDEVQINDLLLEQSARNESLLNGKNISLTLDCDSGLTWYLDADLIGSVINNLLVNAARYARSQVKICASIIDDQLNISIEDDGEGFPEQMLTNLSADTDAPINRLVGSTRLGLLFAQKILALHRTENQEGYLLLTNQGINGGGKVELCIP
jgi:signal transduction histidine kinase